MMSGLGRTIFTSIDCLPKAQDQAERHRIRGLATAYFARFGGHTAGELGELAEGSPNPHEHQIKNMTYHIMKMLHLFPPGDLAYFLWREPLPAAPPNTSAGGASSSASAAMPMIHEISSDEE